jgi:hypothetical protein
MHKDHDKAETERAEDLLTARIKGLIRCLDEGDPAFGTEHFKVRYPGDPRPPFGPLTPVEPFDAKDLPRQPDWQLPWQERAARQAAKIERRLRQKERRWKLFDRLARIKPVAHEGDSE